MNKKYVKALSISLASALLATSLYGCSDKESIKLETKEEYIPSNLTVYGTDKKTIDINNNIYLDYESIINSKDFADSNSTSVTNFMYRTLLNNVYSSKNIDKITKEISKVSMKYQKKEIKKNPKIYEEFISNRIMTEQLLKDYFKIDNEMNKEIKTYDIDVEYFYKKNEGEKEIAKKIISQDLSDKEYFDKYKKERIKIYTDFNGNSKLELLVALNKLDKQNKIKVGDILEIDEPSNLYDKKLKKQKQEFGMYVKIKKINTTKIVPENASQYAYYLAEEKFGDSEKKYYEMINYMDEKSKTYNIPKFVYKYMAHETLEMPDNFSNRFYNEQSLYSDKYNKINSDTKIK